MIKPSRFECLRQTAQRKKTVMLPQQSIFYRVQVFLVILNRHQSVLCICVGRILCFVVYFFILPVTLYGPCRQNEFVITQYLPTAYCPVTYKYNRLDVYRITFVHIFHTLLILMSTKTRTYTKMYINHSFMYNNCTQT